MKHRHSGKYLTRTIRGRYVYKRKPLHVLKLRPKLIKRYRLPPTGIGTEEDDELFNKMLGVYENPELEEEMRKVGNKRVAEEAKKRAEELERIKQKQMKEETAKELANLLAKQEEEPITVTVRKIIGKNKDYIQSQLMKGRTKKEIWEDIGGDLVNNNSSYTAFMTILGGRTPGWEY